MLEIVKSLGVDSTLFIQFIVFLVAYLFLNFLVFRPYMKAHTEREKRTLGNISSADHIHKEVKEMQEKYEGAAREINLQIKNIINESKTSALKEAQKIRDSKKQEIANKLTEGRLAIQSEALKARDSIEAQVPKLAEVITEKLIGRV